MARSEVRIILALLSICGTLSSQPPATSIQIRTDDRQGATLPGAKIELSPLRGSGAGLTAETDSEGNANLDVPGGSYQVLVSRESFCPRRWAVEIPNQRTLNLAFSLRVGPCHVSTVEVIGAPDSGHAESPGPIRETSNLQVLVKDVTGAIVSNADVQARCADSGLTSETKADAEGHALVTLGAGNCMVSVQARGFNGFAQTVDLAGKSHQILTSVLSVGNQCAGCLSIEATEEIEFQRLVPEEAILALPMELAILPVRRLRMHRRMD
jgi:hypothetical protein